MAFRMRAASFFLATCLALPAALGTSTAWAEPSAADKETARSLLDAGDKKFAAKDYAGALKAYQGAHTIMGVPTTGVALAKAQEALGMLVEARDTLLAVARDAPPAKEPAAFTKARAEAKERAPALVARIPAVRVNVQGPPPSATIEVRVDDAPVAGAAASLPRKVNPGKHTIAASSPGFSLASTAVDVKEGETRDVNLTLEASASGAAAAAALAGSATTTAGTPGPASGPAQGAPGADTGTAGTASKTSPLVYVGFGLGGAGIVAGSITGLLSLSHASSAKTNCQDQTCTSAAQDDIDSSKSLGTISTISFGVGLAGVAVGVIGLLTSSHGASAEHVEGAPRTATLTITPVLAPDRVGVLGTF